MLGRSVVAPGDLSRGEALVLSGRAAVRMVGGAAIMLVAASSVQPLMKSPWEHQAGPQASLKGAVPDQPSGRTLRRSYRMEKCSWGMDFMPLGQLPPRLVL